MQSSVSSPVKDFFAGKSIFLTGATGYVGRSLIYKLLKDFDVKSIYIILRAKRGKQFEERERDFKSLELFQHFLPDKSSLNKVIAFQGDICAKNCGLKEEEITILQRQVDIVIHSAASIRFTEPLKRSCVTHIEGTHNVVELASKMHKLKVFLHVSSSSAWINEPVTPETLPTSQLDPYKVAAEFRQYTPEEAMAKEKEYIGDAPKFINSYSTTKTLAEVVIDKNKHNLNKIAIVRPPYLVSSNSEPEAGWFDEPQYAVALSALYSFGFIRTADLNIQEPVQAIPVDLCVNSLLAIIWFMAEKEKETLKVFNLSLTEEIKCTAYEMMPFAIQLGYKYPSINQIRPPSAMFHHNESKVWLKIKSFFTHTLFTLLIDLILVISGRQGYLYRLTSKSISNVENIFERISQYRDKYSCEAKNLKLLYGETGALSPADQNLLFYDLKKCNWFAIAEQGHLNFRRKVLKEPDDTLPAARRRLFYISRIYGIFTFMLQVLLVHLVWNLHLLLLHQTPFIWLLFAVVFFYLAVTIFFGRVDSYSITCLPGSLSFV